ncbi:hypothetical protein ISN44_As11g031650 [Arabidopsis suecica]|uniref:Reverse transcriptase domain-containing protein n=1 Tax=Arabidopsis suecica TaxID=45249 RepID=A0A8T1ZGR1_ARASU|nr:hypothetical protein ISN44_As11g031650 [Arabidopsis suecica]
MGDVPHVGTIHATVNRILTILDKSSRIDVQVLNKTTVLFRIPNARIRDRVLNRKYWHIADIPLVVNEWNPETSLAPPDLSAMPMWIDLKGVHGFVFSHKGLEFISRSVGKFVKLHPNTERCFRLDVARLLVEVNLQKPLTEHISFANEKGEEILVSVSYPWLPPKSSKLKDTSVKPVPEKKPEEDRATTATVQELAQNLLRDLEQSSPFQIPVSEKTDMGEEELNVQNQNHPAPIISGETKEGEVIESDQEEVLEEEGNQDSLPIESGPTTSQIPKISTGHHRSRSRGPDFNMPRKHNVVKSWIQAVRPSFGCFLETRVQESNVNSIISYTLPGWSSISNYDHHRLGRIWVCWIDDVTITPVLKSSQHITCVITIVSSGMSFLCSFVYASNFVVDRRFLWGISDHSRCIIHLSMTNAQHRKPFKLLNFLTSHPQFLSTVGQVWSEEAPLYHSRVAISLFNRKLKKLKSPLRSLNRTHFGNLPRRTKEAYDLYCSMQATTLSVPSQSNIAALSESFENWQRLATLEEPFFSQKSRIKWQLTLESSQVLTQPKEAEAVRHFREFLQKEAENVEEIKVEHIRDLLDYMCSSERCSELTKPVTSEEVSKALHSLPSGKACGPDGLKILLPDFIEPNQSAFVKGRLLLENILLATELVKDYHKDSVAPRSAIKFDISKAFDTIHWPFILTIFRALGFPDMFTGWIFACISTASFSVVINGDLEGFFSSNRGIRQGCSLSPYLFVMVQNVLSKLLDRAVGNGLIGRHPRCNHVLVSHLTFADDILVFTDGSSSSLRETIGVFERFAKMSGLHINASKSEIYVGGRNRGTCGSCDFLRCFEEIERLCGAFLWSGNLNTATGAKIAWTDVCKPKAEGGLGLRRLQDVSRVFSYRLIWRLFTVSGSLWVAWTRHNLMLHGSFWTAPNAMLGSWVWGKLLKIREEVRPFIRAVVGNGKRVSFRYDNWLPLGRILDLTGPSGPRILGIPLNATVRDAVGPQGWKLRRTSFFISQYMGTSSDSSPASVVVAANLTCVFCGEVNESRDHLFFACPYSFIVWSAIAGKLLRHQLNPDWAETVTIILTLTGDDNRDILLRLCFQVSIYSIWRERNSCIHGTSNLTMAQLIRLVAKLIRN